MSVEFEAAIEGAETFTQISELLQGADVNFVVIDEVWQGRQVTSPNHPGSIELLRLSQRVANQFEQKGCTFEESKTLKHLCQKITRWYEETEPKAVMYVVGISNFGRLIELFEKVEPEIDELSQEEAIQHLVNKGIFDEKKLPVLYADMEVYDNSCISDCDYFDRNDDPSLWFTEASWNYQFPGVAMPVATQSIVFACNGNEYASFSIYNRGQIEAAKAQMEAQNRIGA